MNVFNFDTKKVGGIRFVKLGRFTLSFSVSRAYSPIGRKRAAKLDKMLAGPFYAELELMADEYHARALGVDLNR